MNRIAELRKKHGYSQIEIAKQCNIAQNTLSQYETGIRTPTRRVIETLSQIFEVSENYLLGFPEKNTDPESRHQEVKITDVTKVKNFDSVRDVNFHLKLGWHLLYVGTNSKHYDDGTGYSEVEYVLGWIGDPNDTVDDIPGDGEDRIWGWHG